MSRTQQTPRHGTTRRAFLGAAALLPVAVSTGAAGASAAPAPRTVALPAGIRPEGITSGPGTTFYVGSLADGRIVTGDLLGGPVTTLLPGVTGRSLRGLYWDRRTRLVWGVGNLDTTSHLWAVDDTTGAIVSESVVPGAAFLNDLVVTKRKVFVTDSLVDRLTVLPLTEGGMPTGAAPSFVPLGGAWPAGNGTAINANGIRRLPDGSLVLDNSRVGGLWQVDKSTGVAVAIPVSGGPGITSGDGLEIDDAVLYVVRGTGTSAVSVLRLVQSGPAWTARWVRSLTDRTLDVPSTATLARDWLWAVNARFGVPSPGTASYSVTRLPAV